MAVLAAAAIAFSASFVVAWALRGDEGTASAGPDRAPQPVAPPVALTVPADPTAPAAPLPALRVPVPITVQTDASAAGASPDPASGGQDVPDPASGGGTAPADPASPAVTEEAPPIVEDR